MSMFSSLLVAKRPPRLVGLGLIGDVLNTVVVALPPRVVQIGLVVWLSAHGYEYYIKSQQFSSELRLKGGEAAQAEAEALAMRNKIEGEEAQTANARAELRKLQTEAALIESEVNANSAATAGGPARLAQIRSEIDLARAQADKADAEAKAQSQLVNGGIELSVAQKKAEIAGVEGDIRKALTGLCILVSVSKDGFGIASALNLGVTGGSDMTKSCSAIPGDW
jgi:hypothetical protein